jgi:hypothetical protein
MNETSSSSSVTTGAVTFSAVAVQPVIVWMAAGFPMPMPPDVSLFLAAALVSLAHAGYNIVQTKLAAKAAATLAPIKADTTS